MTVFQIIRLDKLCVEIVDLQLENNIIGSSVVATGSDDESVVKDAFTINLARNDEMTMTPALPCYMKSRESSRWQLLESGVTVPIKPGDICALLQRKFWFKIISSTDNMELVCQSGTKRKVHEDLADSNVDTADKKLCVESQENADHNRIQPGTESSMNNGTGQGGSKEDEVESCPKKEEEIIQISESGQEVQHESKSGDETCSAILLDNENTTISENPESQCNKEAQGDSQRLETTDSTSNQQSQSSNSGPSEVAGSGEPSTKSWREKCKYGEKCYRHNSNHKSKYSHPGDVDYDIPDDREECPYGKMCYRKNSQHKAQFKHTAKNNTGSRTRSTKRSTGQTYQNDLSQGDDFYEDSAEESVDESEYDPSSDSEDNSDDEQYSSGIEWEDETVV